MIFSDRVPLAETIVVPDIFVSGLARIEEVGGGNLRFTFYTNQRSTAFNDERAEHLVVARIVLPLSAVESAVNATRVALEGVQGVINNVFVDRAH